MAPKLNSTIVENASSVDDSVFDSDVDDESESEVDSDNDDNFDVLLEDTDDDDDHDHDHDESFDKNKYCNSVDRDYLFLNNIDNANDNDEKDNDVDTYVDHYTIITTATTTKKTTTGSTPARNYLPSISSGNSNDYNNDDFTVVCKNYTNQQLPKNTFVSTSKSSSSSSSFEKSNTIMSSSLSTKIPKSSLPFSLLSSFSTSFSSNIQKGSIVGIIIILLCCYGCISTYCSFITERTILLNEIQIQQTIINTIQQQYSVLTKENILVQQQLVTEMEQVQICNRRNIQLIKNYDISKKDILQKQLHTIHTIQYKYVLQKTLLLTIINIIHSTWNEHYQNIIIDNNHLYKMLHMSTLTTVTTMGSSGGGSSNNRRNLNDRDDSMMVDDDTIDWNTKYDSTDTNCSNSDDDDDGDDDGWNKIMYPTTIDYKRQLQQTLKYIQGFKNNNSIYEKYNWMMETENSTNNDDRATTGTRSTFRGTSTRNNNNNNNILLLLEWGCWYLYIVTHHKSSTSSNNQRRLLQDKQIIISAGGLSFLSHVLENYYYYYDADHVNNNNNNSYVQQKENYIHTMALKTIQTLTSTSTSTTTSRNTKEQQQEQQELTNPLSKTEQHQVAAFVTKYQHPKWETTNSRPMILDILYSILITIWKWATYTNSILYTGRILKVGLNTVVDSSWQLATNTLTTFNDFINSAWYNNYNTNNIDDINDTSYNTIGNYVV